MRLQSNAINYNLLTGGSLHYLFKNRLRIPSDGRTNANNMYIADY